MKQNEIEILLNYIQGLNKNPEQASLNPEEFSEDTRLLAQELLKLGNCVQEAQQIAVDLANGEIDGDYCVYANALAAPLKNVQSNLRHLAWIAERISSGDYRQKVFHLGRMTEAFNRMTDQLKNHHEEMKKLINTDYLTGLGNRRAYNEVSERLLEKKTGFCIAFIDIDCLKYCNDQCGHWEGDQYILSVGKTLQGICGEREQVFRIAGDEFLLISETAAEEELELRLKTARKVFLEKQKNTKQYVRDFSYGCVFVKPGQLCEPGEILGSAEKKMYNSKMIHYLQRQELPDYIDREQEELDRSGLDHRIFEVFANSAANSYMYICNMKTNVSRWSAKAVVDFDLPGEYMYDARNIWKNHIHPEDRQLYEEDVDAVFQGRKQFHDVEYRAKMKDGNYVICSCRGTILRGIGKDPDLFAGTITNHGIVDNIDSVTSLYNVYEFLNQLKRLRKDRKEAMLLGISLSRFSTINDAYGYVWGNHLLKELAKKMENHIRGKGQIFRLDGAKFVCIFDSADEQMVKSIYNDLIEIARKDITVDDIHIVMPIHGALLKFKFAFQEINMVYAELVHAMARAKQKNLGELICYDSDKDQKLQEERELLRVIRKSIQNDCRGFYLLYQPQFNGQGKLIGAEALLRWESEKYGIVPPSVYVPYMEKEAGFYDLGLWILRQAVRDTAEIVRRYPEFKVSVNISYRQIEHYGFRDDVMKLLIREAFPAQNLVLELTEHCQTLNTQSLEQEIKFFRSQGIGIAADDFGTGYSSFSLMKQLSFDCIKIDQSFILHVMEDKTDQIMVESIISCAKALGLKICVEGVETEEIFRFVKKYEVDLYQGYLLGRPSSCSDLRKKLDA